MAYRRSKGTYSSADAYRSLRNPAVSAVSPTLATSNPSPPGSSHAHSSEEEAHLTSPDPRRTDSPSPYERDHSPLSPPRPFFLAGSRTSSSGDRQSWNSTADSSVDPQSDSDRDNTDREASSSSRSRASARRQASSPTSGMGVSTTGPLASSAARPRLSSSEAEVTAATAATAAAGSVRARNHHRRRSSSITPADGAGRNPFDTPPIAPARAPPSAFPFLSHSGNPDPGTPIPGSLARRASQESFRRLSGSGAYSPMGVAYPAAGAGGYAAVGTRRASVDGEGYSPEYDPQGDLGRPYAPFMGGEDRASWNGSNGSSGYAGAGTPPAGSGASVYRNSAAGAMAGSSAALGEGMLPRTNSQPTIAMRAPFLSPASRPSSIWSPPSYPQLPSSQHLTSAYPPSLTYMPTSPYGTGTSPYPKRTRALMPSSRLPSKLSKEDKPWLNKKSTRERVSWWLTVFMMFLGFGAAAVIVFFGWTGVHQLKDSDVCMVLNENFNTLDLDNTWHRDVELGGFGNGEFQMTTDSSDNLYIHNNQLYIMPTLTTDEIGKDHLFNGFTYKLDGCTAGSEDSSNGSGTGNCSATSDASSSNKAVIPPVKSARLSTQGHYTIQYGRVEVRAKLPRGDWLWPAIWMLPSDTSKYGPWPLSGEIDIMEARGNAQSYAAQGVNFIRSSLNYGILETLQTHIFGWWQEKRFTYADDFHVYGFEWTPDWMRFYVDTRLQAMMNIKITGKGGHSFFDDGHYPQTANNGSDTQVAVTNIWKAKGGGAAAPFDQEFFLILDLAAGGTSGWFPDGVGGKPWLDKSETAMHDFANAQSTWAATWPKSADDRAFRIDYVKMWKLRKNGRC